MSSLVELLITVLIGGLVVYLIFWAMGYLGAPEPIRKVVTVIIVVICVVYLLANFMPGVGHTGWWHR